jgi:hypothetical protein
MPDPLDPPPIHSGDPLDPSASAAAEAAEIAMTDAFLVQRKTVTDDGAGSQSAAWDTLATVAGALTTVTRYTETVQAGGLKGVTLWKLALPVGTDVLPADRVLQCGRFRVALGLPSGGDFTLTWDGEETANIAYNAASDDVEAALEDLFTIGPANVTVRGPEGGPFVVTVIGDLIGSALALTGDGAGLTDGALVIARPTYEVIDTDEGLTDATVLTASVVRVRR